MCCGLLSFIQKISVVSCCTWKGLPFGRSPTFYILRTIRRENFQYTNKMFLLFRAIVKFCSTNRLLGNVNMKNVAFD